VILVTFASKIFLRVTYLLWRAYSTFLRLESGRKRWRGQWSTETSQYNLIRRKEEIKKKEERK